MSENTSSTPGDRLSRLQLRWDALDREIKDLISKRNAITELAEEEARDELSEEEETEYRGLSESLKAKQEEALKVKDRIAEVAEETLRSEQLTAGAAAVRRARASVQITNEARTYDKANPNRSYILDLARDFTGRGDVDGARARLRRHAQEIATEAPAEYRADLNRTDGTGGYFAPPLWMMNEWIAYARPGRATANIVSNHSLPGGTDSINIPKIATGTATAVQTADNAAVNETDLTDTFVQANVKTIAGQQSVALQLIEQSPVNFDQVIFGDLAADQAQRLDLQVINGSGASGQVTGILGTSGIQTVTYSDTTQNAGTMYAAIANAIQLVHSNRFAPPTAIVMHPRRWGALLAARDSQNRPLFLPDVQAPMNAMGILGEVGSQGVVGNVQGLPVVVDANIPTNLGAGTNQDTILIMRTSDISLFEGGLRSRVLNEVKGQNLEVVLQVYSYFAFTAARYPAGIVQISGTGLTPPSFT